MIGAKSFGSPNGVINLARVLELTLQEGEWADFEAFTGTTWKKYAGMCKPWQPRKRRNTR